jgi:sugar diacid utilization regulator
MTISLQLLLRELGMETEDIPRVNPMISRAVLFSSSLAMKISDNSYSDALVVSDLSDALACTSMFGADTPPFLCVCKNYGREYFKEDIPPNIMITKANPGLTDLFNDVSEVFSKLNRWINKMQESVIRNRGLQDLLDISESIIGNHIAIMDSSFRLLAYTKNIRITDPVQSELIKNGYYTEETLRKLHKFKRIEKYKNAQESEFIINRKHNISNKDTIQRVFKNNGIFTAVAVMLCENRPCDKLLLELFDPVLKYAKHYFEREQSPYKINRQIETFLEDMIQRKLASEKEARARANTLQLQFTGAFELNLLIFSDTINIPEGRLMQDLSQALADAIVSPFSDHIVIIFNLEKKFVENRREKLSRLVSYLGCSCGISSKFSSLWDIAAAYQQAHSSVLIGERLRIAEDGSAKFHFYDHEDYFIYNLVNSAIDSIPSVLANSFAFEAIRTLRDYDAKHKTNLIKALAILLRNESNATSTSEKLHVHRNTVLYQIKKIEELIGLPLDEPGLRLKLSIGLRAYELNRL